MSIIRTTDWIPPVTTPYPRVQDFKENPEVAYRELLMSSFVDPDTNEETPIPYVFEGTIPTEGFVIVRIPHALSLNSQGLPGQLAAGRDARIPDVVIPIPVFDLAAPAIPPGAAIVAAWNTMLLTQPSSTGMWADENYVYLAIIGIPDAPFHINAAIYVEYTHSVITNEIVTSEYYQLAPIPIT